jgi:hypothetical protein
LGNDGYQSIDIQLGNIWTEDKKIRSTLRNATVSNAAQMQRLIILTPI